MLALGHFGVDAKTRTTERTTAGYAAISTVNHRVIIFDNEEIGVVMRFVLMNYGYS
jgi:hypothetical protein